MKRAILLLSVFFLTACGTSLSTQNVSSVGPNDHVKGPLTAKVTLIEYADFQCPACGAYHPIVKQLKEKFSDRVQFAFRHFPLRQIHANADLSSRAAEAAGAQGKFWEMHDWLMEHQNEWAKSSDAEEMFVKVASEELKLDAKKFETDLDSDAASDKIENDEKSGFIAGVKGTPTFFLNGKFIQNPRGYEPFEALLLEALGETK